MDQPQAAHHSQETAKHLVRPKIHALTSTRFFAALYVIFFHTRWGVTPGSMLDKFFALGFISVGFFFLLSGYILAVVYLRGGKPIVPRSFYLARFARIYPLYIVSVLLGAPFSVAARVPQYGLKVALERVAALLAASTVMLQMWVPNAAVINIPSWSLAIETVFYLSFPLVGVAIWKLSKRTIWPLGATLWIGGLAMNWLLAHFRPNYLSGMDLASQMTTFATGILLARWQANRESQTPPKSTTPVAAWAVLILACACFAATVYASPWIRSTGLNFSYLLTPFFAAIIWVFSSAQIAPVRLMSVKWLVILGEASYGLYLLHNPVGHFFLWIHLPERPASYPIYLGTCIALSVLSFYFFETPMRRWILGRFHTRTKETMETATVAS